MGTKPYKTDRWQVRSDLEELGKSLKLKMYYKTIYYYLSPYKVDNTRNSTHIWSYQELPLSCRKCRNSEKCNISFISCNRFVSLCTPRRGIIQKILYEKQKSMSTFVLCYIAKLI